MSVELGTEFGGCGSTFFSSIITIEELAKVDASISVLCDLQNTLLIPALLKYGTKEQQERYLPDLASKYVSRFYLIFSYNFFQNYCCYLTMEGIFHL